MKLFDEAYEFLYSRFLSRLDEETAMNLGRNVLKRLPIEYLPFDVEDERLRVRIGDCVLPNPVILSSYYYDPRILYKAMRLGFGAVTTKTITVNPREGNPEPTVVRTENGIVNCDGHKNPGMKKAKEMFTYMRKTKPLIVSIGGESIDDFCILAGELEDCADMIELNISCPNVDYGLNFYDKPEKAKDLFREVRTTTKKPLIVKLSPDFEGENFKHVIPNAVEQGIEAVNFGNTKRVKEPRLSLGYGGLSGPRLYDNVLRNIYYIYKEFKGFVKIIATGGIDSPGKAYLAMVNGADMFSYLTGFPTKGLGLARSINKNLLKRLEEDGADNLDRLRKLVY